MSPNPMLTPTEAMMRVAVVSDDDVLGATLSTFLDQQGDVEVTALSLADVALWDSGADAHTVGTKLGEIAELNAPALALLPDAAQASAALGAGARGVILRNSDGASLVSALRAVRGGLTVLDGQLAGSLISPERSEQTTTFEPLTVRETEVIQLLAEGLSNKQIARRLTISEHTAKFHIGRILAKLDADTRTEAVVRALRHGVVALD